jgi:predicted small secreted protein
MKTRDSMKRAPVCVLVLALALTGCTTTRSADVDSADGKLAVAAGDRVRVVTHDGRKLKFTVDKVEGRVLVGHQGSKDGNRVSLPEEIRLPFDEIAEIEVKELDGWKSAGVAAGTAAGLVLIIGLTFIALAF